MLTFPTVILQAGAVAVSSVLLARDLSIGRAMYVLTFSLMLLLRILETRMAEGDTHPLVGFSVTQVMPLAITLSLLAAVILDWRHKHEHG
jgi:hypothetical protein